MNKKSLPAGRQGFSLVELLVIVSLITVLSVVGLVMFQSARGKAQEARVKADLDAIKKAFEKNYDASLNNGQGGYKPLSPNDFVSGEPKDKNGNSYIVTTTNSDGSISSYVACINPQTGEVCTGPNSFTCACATSTQGAGSQVSNITNPSCDPYGILGNGLVGYWKFDESSWNGNCTAAPIIDSSGSNNSLRYCRWDATGNIVNAGTVTSSTGKFGNSSNITNTTDGIYQSVGNLQSSLNPGLGSMTWTGWFKTGSANGGSFYRKSGSSNTGGVNIYIANDGKIRCDVHYSPYIRVTSYASTYADNQWHFYACVLDRSTNQLLLYADGNLAQIADARAISSVNLNQGDIFIGTSGASSAYVRLNGSLDDLRVYNRAFSSSEVSSLRNVGNGCVPN